MKSYIILLLSLPFLCNGAEPETHLIKVKNKSSQTLRLLYQSTHNNAPCRTKEDILLFASMDRHTLPPKENCILFLKKPQVSIATLGSVTCTITDKIGKPLIAKDLHIEDKLATAISQNGKIRAILYSDETKESQFKADATVKQIETRSSKKGKK